MLDLLQPHIAMGRRVFLSPDYQNGYDSFAFGAIDVNMTATGRNTATEMTTGKLFKLY